MTKYEALDALKAQDIKCDIDKGILWIYGMDRRKAKKILTAMGYDATFGVRAEKVHNNGQQE